jgi:hypothetical protein
VTTNTNAATNSNAATGNGGNGNGNNGNGNNGNGNNGNAATNNNDDPNCGFPNGPDCTSLGNVNGLEQFADDGCCILPFRCGNVEGERCERVEVVSKRRRSMVWTA